MNKLELQSLHLENFKGVKDFILDLQGKNGEVKGDNGTGKTTNFDALTFLLFGKDSQNKSNFEIKTLDQDGNVKEHDVDHSVEGSFKLDDKPFTLKRVYSEKWTKKRGAFERELTGHTTAYYINGTKKKKSEYEKFVAAIVSEKVFKLITNPVYFNEYLDMKERRETLINISGGVKDIEVAAGVPMLKEFLEGLEGMDIKDYADSLKEKRKDIEQKKDRNDIRIDELRLALPDNPIDVESTKEKIKGYDAAINELHEQIRSVRSGQEIFEKRKELSSLEYEIVKLKNENKMNGMENVHLMKTKLQEMQNKIKELRAYVENNKEMINQYGNMIAEYEQEMEAYRNQWKEKKKEVFTHNSECNCPACGQELPKEQIEAARQKAEEHFNMEKAEALQKIQRMAGAKKDNAAKLQEKTKNLLDYNDKIQAEMADLKKAEEAKKQEIIELEQNAENIEETEAYKQKIQQKKEISMQIQSLENESEKEIQRVQAETERIKGEKSALEIELVNHEAAEKTKQRIADLEDAEKDLAKQHENIAYKLHMVDEFTKKKVEMLENKINEQFEHTKFKLFETQVNGNINEICKATFNGVPYETSLNSAARLNTGLDIINTLNKFYGVTVPIFVDNSESVNHLIGTEAQLIKLTVSDDESLQVTTA